MKVALGILFLNGRVLIGRRKEKDFLIPRLTWVFPGGKVSDEESPRIGLKREFKRETGFNVRIKRFLFSRVPSECSKITLFYYEVEPISGSLRAGGDLKELKWVKPTEVVKYFTTSIDLRVMNYLKALEQKI